jgi:glycosyltransferase involved in cell wall biosynthesis
MSRRSRNFYHKKHVLAKFFERFLHQVVNLLLANSKVVAEDLIREGAPAKNVKLLYNGIKLDLSHTNTEIKKNRLRVRSELGIHENTIVISCIANLFSYKGHEDLLDAVHELGIKFTSNCCLLLIGRDESYKVVLENKVSHLGLTRFVKFLGERLDTTELLDASDIGVLVSHQEGFSNAVLEYMASRLPVVVSDVGGNAEVVCNNQSGFVVPPHNPSEIAKALEKLILSRDLRILMGENAYEKVKADFSLSACVEAYEDIYSSIDHVNS